MENQFEPNQLSLIEEKYSLYLHLALIGLFALVVFLAWVGFIQ